MPSIASRPPRVIELCSVVTFLVLCIASQSTAQGLSPQPDQPWSHLYSGPVAAAPAEGLGPLQRLFAGGIDPFAPLAGRDLAVQTKQEHPQPAHTGLKALIFETASDFNSYPRRKSTWVILAMGGAAAAIAHPFDDEVTESLAGSEAAGKFFAAGKHIGAVYTQAGVAVGLYLVGRYMLPHAEGAPRTNKVSHIGFDLLRALAVSQALTQGIKVAVRRDRPTGECCAFPSGHASAAFATASVVERHLGYRGSWPTFLIATYVATSRLHDNRHFLSDVLFGASVGISSGWTVVGRHGRSNFALTPVAVPRGMMVAFTRKAPLS